jgi:hypothetical protein
MFLSGAIGLAIEQSVRKPEQAFRLEAAPFRFSQQIFHGHRISPEPSTCSGAVTIPLDHSNIRHNE